jgi:serine/threonine protein kinase
VLGQKLGHYEIVTKLGAGGMGEVYRARDTRLERDVAIKVLPVAALSDEAARARLLREARAAAGLNHPHICTIYEVGEAEGQAYIAMELVEGQPLSDSVSAGPLPGAQVLRYALQIAGALAHAHERGVVHRDLKSANVVLTPDGRAKVLDFGLAKRLTGDESEAATRSQPSLTRPGAIVGTLAYMAPEQLRGEPADARSDIWALGVVLYEMAAGNRPFRGPTGFVLSSAILNQAPAPLPAGVAGELQAVIERCLEKEPARRYQRAGEVRAALEAIQSGTVDRAELKRAQLGKRRLAVLPFENLSGDAGQDYFVEGTHEGLITDLARLSGLRVIARPSVMRYKGTEKPLPQVAEELKVDTVLTGSVMRSGERVRVTAQLIEAATEECLWADRFERDVRDVLSLQNEMVAAIARGIELRLTPSEQARLVSARRVNPEAYEAYLKGRFHWFKLLPAELERAMQYFQLALEKDPDLALAHVGLAMTWMGLNAAGVAPPTELYPRMEAAARKAIELDPALAEAHDLRAWALTWYHYDWPAAERSFRRALELNPNHAHGRSFFGLFLSSMTRWDEGRAEAERALELDPHNAFFQWIWGMQLLLERRFDEAIVEMRRSQPGFPTANWGLWHAYHAQQRFEEALAEARAGVPLRTPHVPDVAEALSRGFTDGGYVGAMRRAAQTLEARSGQVYVGSDIVAELYAAAREIERGMHWLEKAYEEHQAVLVYLNVHPIWDSLREQPRFQALLRKMNLPP